MLSTLRALYLRCWLVRLLSSMPLHQRNHHRLAGECRATKPAPLHANQMFAQSMVYEPLVKYQADGR